MSLNELTPEKKRQILTQITHYQLYVGEDRIQGRNAQDTMQIKGSEALLEHFIGELEKLFPLIADHKIAEFLTALEQQFQMPYSAIREDIERNYNAMMEFASEEESILCMILARVMEYLRETVYQKYGTEYVQRKYTQDTGKPFGADQQEKVRNLGQLSDPLISVLYNLTFIAFLADKYGNPTQQTVLKRLVSTKVNLILKKIEEGA